MLKKMTGTFITIGALALITAAPGLSLAQTNVEDTKEHEHMHGKMKSGGSDENTEASSCCQKMSEKKMAMHEKHLDSQAELDQLVSRVNSTTGDEQQAAIAELLTKIVQQRQQMGQMMHTHSEMMKGKMAGGMSDCPMMKKNDEPATPDPADKGDEDHSEHH